MPNEFILQQTSIPEKKYNSQTLVGNWFQERCEPASKYSSYYRERKFENNQYNVSKLTQNDFFKSNQNWLNYQKQQNDQFLTTHQRAFKAPKEQTKTDLFPSIVKKSLPTKDPKELSEYSSKWTTAPHYWDRTYAGSQK